MSLSQLIGAHIERYREHARVLYLRLGPLHSMSDFQQTQALVFDEMWGRGSHGYSTGLKRWANPHGAYFTLGILPDQEKGKRYYETTYQGRSFTLIVADEAQMWARPEVLDLLSSNLRGKNTPLRMIYAANPGGIGHQWLAQRYVQNGAKPWSTFGDEREVPDGKGGKIYHGAGDSIEAKTNLRRLTDEHGIAYSTPVLLDGEGQPLNNPNIPGQIPDPIIGKWKYYTEEEYRQLPIFQDVIV